MTAKIVGPEDGEQIERCTAIAREPQGRGGAHAAADGTTLDQLINMAVAEKISALKTAAYLAERGGRAAVPRALKLLRMAGRKAPLLEGDEVE